MNKYEEAIEVIDTLLHLMCGEEREDGYKPTMEEMSNSMDLLKDLANKADLKHEEMTAIKMFKELGYEYSKERDRNKIIEYYDRDNDSIILFWVEEREFSISEYGETKDITVDKFKAIQQQLKELGWI